MAADVFLPTQRHLLTDSTLYRICSVVMSWILASRWKHFLASLHALSFLQFFFYIVSKLLLFQSLCLL